MTFGQPVELGDQGALKPGRLLWLRSLLWLFGLAFLLVLAIGSLGEFARRVVPASNLPLQFATQCAGAAIALGAYILAVRLVERRRASELAWRPALAELAMGLLVGLLMFAAVMAILIGGGLYEITINGANPAWRAGGAAIMSGVLEELIVRGVILRLLWRGFGPVVAFVVSAALFGAGHLPNANSSLFAALCIAIEAGVMLGAFYALTGRLWVSIGVHAAWNFTQGYVFGAAVSGTDFGASLATSTAIAGYPHWLTGGAFGPEASLPGLLVCSSVGFAALYAAWKAGRFAAPPAAEQDATLAAPAVAEG
ncbi:CPBP family intramembrane glutamic endopeptidase [Sphingomonas parva]|uniref:CPBP family intramembrane glutamic endopeptidase n=1 Tax=Sphingomonas parva TaxID=2555898 RepID=UPI00177BC44E|nr:CPBP family intramembrane glutamic endopeptidase [Sphingomonas parva]